MAAAELQFVVDNRQRPFLMNIGLCRKLHRRRAGFHSLNGNKVAARRYLASTMLKQLAPACKLPACQLLMDYTVKQISLIASPRMKRSHFCDG